MLVDAEGSVTLVSLTGEISYQLTIADHQKQAAAYGTSTKTRIKIDLSDVIESIFAAWNVFPT